MTKIISSVSKRQVEFTTKGKVKSSATANFVRNKHDYAGYENITRIALTTGQLIAQGDCQSDGTYFFAGYLGGNQLKRAHYSTITTWPVIVSNYNGNLRTDNYNNIIYKRTDNYHALSQNGGDSWTVTTNANILYPTWVAHLNKWVGLTQTGTNPTIVITFYTADTFDGTWTATGATISNSAAAYGIKDVHYEMGLFYITLSYGNTFYTYDAVNFTMLFIGGSAGHSISTINNSESNYTCIVESWPQMQPGNIYKTSGSYNRDAFSLGLLAFSSDNRKPYHIFWSQGYADATIYLSTDGISLTSCGTTTTMMGGSGNAMNPRSAGYAHGIYCYCYGNSSDQCGYFYPPDKLYRTVTY